MNQLNEKSLSIEDLLPCDYQTIVGEALRDAVISWFRELSDDNKARIITNMGYYNMFNIIKEEFPDVSEQIKQYTIDHINKKENYSFYIFGNDHFSGARAGQTIINNTIISQQETIRDKTNEAISEMSKKDIKQFMMNFQYKFKNPNS